MKRGMNVEGAEYRALLVDFETWLGVLGYAERSVGSRSAYVRQCLAWLVQARGKRSMAEVCGRDMWLYVEQMRVRPSERDGGGVSASHINGAISSLRLFVKYLRLHCGVELEVELRREVELKQEYRVLSREEVQKLYAVEDGSVYGLRSRALLGMLYGCGLRVGEVWQLDCRDVDVRRQLVAVRRGKGGSSRVVPLCRRCAEDVAEYVREGRPWFSSSRRREETGALFVNQRGGRLGIEGIARSMQKLGEAAELEVRVRPHGLRHAIATHLLQGGMAVERIARFLGHRSLESTQLYTHVVRGKDG